MLTTKGRSPNLPPRKTVAEYEAEKAATEAEKVRKEEEERQAYHDKYSGYYSIISEDSDEMIGQIKAVASVPRQYTEQLESQQVLFIWPSHWKLPLAVSPAKESVRLSRTADYPEIWLKCMSPDIRYGSEFASWTPRTGVTLHTVETDSDWTGYLIARKGVENVWIAVLDDRLMKICFNENDLYAYMLGDYYVA